MNRLFGRFLLLLPPVSYIITYVLIYLGCNVPNLLWQLNNPGMPAPPGYSNTRRTVLVAGLMAYGIYRAFAFHPFFRNGYRKWLETTPWTWRKPLPVGPVRPVWEDAIIVSVMSASGWYLGDLDPLASFCLPMGTYLTVLSLTFPATGAWGFHIAVSFAVGLAVRFWNGPPWTYTGAILLAWAIGSVGLSRALKHWPWSWGLRELDPNHLETLGGGPAIVAQTTLGWPYDRLGPRTDKPMTRKQTIDSFFACVLAAWWFYAVLALIPDAGRPGLAAMVLLNVTMVGGIIRLSRYTTGHASPLSLVGRIGRFRPIIPSYDQVFLAPIAAMFAALAGPWMLTKVGYAWDAASAMSLGAALLALSLGGPDRRRWQLTAKHRLHPAIANASKAQNGFIQVG